MIDQNSSHHKSYDKFSGANHRDSEGVMEHNYNTMRSMDAKAEPNNIQAIIKQELGLSSDTNSLSKAGLSLTGLEKFNLPGAKQQLRNMFDKLKKCKCQQAGPNQPVN